MEETFWIGAGSFSPSLFCLFVIVIITRKPAAAEHPDTGHVFTGLITGSYWYGRALSFLKYLSHFVLPSFLAFIFIDGLSVWLHGLQ